MLRMTCPIQLGRSIVFAFLVIITIPRISIGAAEDTGPFTNQPLYSSSEAGVSLVGVTTDGELILQTSGAGLNGIAGTGLRGIAGTGLNGIAGTGLRGIAGTGLNGIAGTGLRSTTFEPIPLAVVGPISSITEQSPVEIVINGQVVSLDPVSTIIAVTDGNITINSIDHATELLTIGDYVAVAGEIIDSGHQLATYIVQLTESYTAGSSPIYIRARLDSNPSDAGSVYSGATLIDQSNALYEGQLTQVTSGQTVEYIGYATDSDANTFFATSGRQITNVSGIAGTGLNGIAGTGLGGIAGTGLNGIAGTGLRGIAGTGLNGIAGTGLRGIAGTGLNGIAGTGLQ